MEIREILIAIEEEIARLQGARELLTASGETDKGNKRRGRSVGPVKGKTIVEANRPQRKMSEEGRARIAAAQKKRWAAQKKASKKAIPIARKSKPGTKLNKKTVGLPKKRTLASNAAAARKPISETATAEA